MVAITAAADALDIAVHGVQPGLLIPGRGEVAAVRHRQPQGMAELGCCHGQPEVEIHHLSALHRGGGLNGLGLSVFPQHPLDHSKDADRRHHKSAFIDHQGQELFGPRAIGEHLNPARGIHDHPWTRHSRSPSR